MKSFVYVYIWRSQPVLRLSSEGRDAIYSDGYAAPARVLSTRKYKIVQHTG